VALVGQAGSLAQEDLQPISGESGTSEWPAHKLVVEHCQVRVGTQIRPGSYDVRVRLADEATGAQYGQSAIVAYLRVEHVPRSYEPPPRQFPAEGCFGDRLCARGYDLYTDDDRFGVVFYWQATKHMEHDYVMSTRLMDLEGSGRTWQRDAAPREWRYPTTW
jgi:hypothetical protein